MPEALINREADNWEPLLVMADACGADWPERAREAAVILGGKAEETLGIELLADIRTVWAAEQADRFTSKEMAAKLVALEDRPWSEYRRGDPITQRQLAQLLKPFGIEPRNLRTQSTRGNGYCAAAFEDAFKRYLPPSPLLEP